MARLDGPEIIGLLDAAPDALVAVDADGCIVLVNAQAERLFGYRREDLLGQQIDLLVPEQHRAAHPDHRHRYVGDPRPRPMGVGMELSARRRDGTTFPAEISLSSIDTHDGTVVAAAIRDASERIELQAERARLKAQADRERIERQLQQSQRLESLGQLAGGVAHDFNNLLGAIMNYAHFVAEEIGRAADGDTQRPWEQARHDIGQIQLATERAAALTHQLLAFARREVVRPQVIDLNAVVDGLEPLLRRTIGEHVELVIDLADDLAATLADPGQIEQVLVNLAVNARDAMPDGGLLILETANVHAPGRDDQDTAISHREYVRLRVSDTGVGMSPGTIERAFEPFFTTKPKGAGSGLGLATVYGIVAQAGGATLIESQPGEGTAVTVLLPVTDSAPTTVASAATAAAPAPTGETILLVEDEDLMRDVVARILIRNGYQVISANGGAQALDLAARHDGPIDLLLSDLVMPKMLGKEVAERLHRERPDTPVLFMSGYAQSVMAPDGEVEEGVVLIEKPFSEGALLTALRKMLDEPVR